MKKGTTNTTKPTNGKEKEAPIVTDNIPYAEEVSEDEMPLEKVIDNALIKANVTERVLADLKKQYGGLKLKSIDDKESYLEIKEAKKEVRKVGILTEKICEKGRERALQEQRLWLAKEKEVGARIMEVQAPLEAEMKRFEDEQERKELEEKKRQEERYINRQSQLIKMGAQYQDGSFVLNHISYEASLLKEADDDMWNDTVLPKYKRVYEEIEAEKVEQENKRKALLEAQLQQQAEFEAKQREFQLQQEAFTKQQRELQEQKDALERYVRLAQERKDQEEREAKQKVIDARIFQIRDLGMEYNYSSKAYVFGDVQIFRETQIDSLNDIGWNALIEEITPRIQEILRQSQIALEENLEREKQAAIKKALEEQEAAKQEAEVKRQQELDMASDKEKYSDTVSYLRKTPIHAMKSNIYKGKMNIINDFIKDL